MSNPNDFLNPTQDDADAFAKTGAPAQPPVPDPADKPDPVDDEGKPAKPKAGDGEPPKTTLGDGPAQPEPEPEVIKTGDARMDVALTFMAKVGIKTDDPAVVAAKSGDFGLIRAKLATMGDKAKGWEEHVKLVEDAHKEHVAAATKRNEEVQGIVVTAAGSKEEWAKVQQWASQNADDDEKEDINAAFAKGGKAAKRAAEYLVEAYRKKNGVAPAPAAKPDAGRSAAGGNPLSAKEYQAEVAKLQAESRGRDISGTAAYQLLQARRVAGMRVGAR